MVERHRVGVVGEASDGGASLRRRRLHHLCGGGGDTCLRGGAAAGGGAAFLLGGQSGDLSAGGLCHVVGRERERQRRISALLRGQRDALADAQRGFLWGADR